MLHAFITGRVQGVSFRAGIKGLADKLGLKGWVKNLSDGRVEVKAAGEAEPLKKLLIFLKKGPEGAKVEKTDYYYEKDEEFEEFTIEADW